MNERRILVAMSGGVDSSVAALLLQCQGYDVVGMTAELFGDVSAAGPCCGREGIGSAQAVCEHLGIPHRKVDLTQLFEERVIGRFISEYRAGRTPNPCTDCNRFIKFDEFFKLAQTYDCQMIATGHHARIVTAPGGSQVLATSVDADKDQSYFLACIPPARLEHIRFPVGEHVKAWVRQTAADAGLPSAARPESQDICFISNEAGIAQLMGWHTGKEPRPGLIVDEQGHTLGKHPGIEHFTIGQRKGLGLGGGTEGLVVHRLEPKTNTVVVARYDAHAVACFSLREFTCMAPGFWQPGGIVEVRTRYRQPLWPARVIEISGCIAIEPDGLHYGVAPGQWCVGYCDDVVLFSGIIDEITYRT